MQYFDELVLALELVIVGAYDGESYVFWEPRTKGVVRQIKD